jgi:glutamyl-tRNA synthetase
MSDIRVRFAPSPTGYLHIGGLRTALYNELFARKQGGAMILRIEDTDQSRYVDGAVQNLLQSLQWAGVEHDEGVMIDDQGQISQIGDYGPYFQSERLNIYREHVNQLLESGHAYRCFCPAERLAKVRSQQQADGRPVMYDRHCREHLSPEQVDQLLQEGRPHVVRLKVPLTGRTDFTDAVRGLVSFPNDTIDDQVLLKSDGFPTYHLANVVDDHLMKITHVIRGEEWLPSTPKHVMLYQAFGWELPVFAHLPLLLNPDRSKLSKRQNSVAVEDYRQKGFLPEALYNFVALLGHNPSGDKELYVKGELVDGFELEKVNKGGAVFNTEKLDWMNTVYLRALPIDKLQPLVMPELVDQGVLTEKDGRYLAASGEDVTERVPRVLSLEQSRAERLADYREGLEYFFDSSYEIKRAKLPWTTSDEPTTKQRLEAVVQLLEKAEAAVFATPDSLEELIRGMIETEGWSNGEVLWPTRFALTGQKASPSPFEVLWALGPAESISRLKRAVNLLES